MSTDEKVFLPPEEPAGFSGFKSKVSLFYTRLFSVIKLLLGLLLLLFVYSTSVSFLNEAGAIEQEARGYFFFGVIAFLIAYLFVWEPQILYAKGQKLLQKIFSFFAPLVKVAPYLLPVYTILLFAVYTVYAVFDKSTGPLTYFLLLCGFTLALHLVFSARSLRSRQSDFLKANYIFGFSFIYVINICIIAFGFSLIFEKFSFVNFCNHSFKLANEIMQALYRQLFL